LTNITQTTTTFKQIDCHKGNSPVFTQPNGGTLFIGGWTRDASFNWNTHVIDLTGQEHKFNTIPMPFDEISKDFMPFVGQSYAGWLSLPFPDFGVPSQIRSFSQWEGIASTIRKLLISGKDVLVACTGGHGRSGLFCAIVGYILDGGNDVSWESPVEKIRDLHCHEAVETYGQEKFIYDVLGLDIQVTRSYATQSHQMTGMTYKACPICSTQSMFVSEKGMCLGCEHKAKNGDFGIVPVRTDLTLEDIKNKGKVPHECTTEKCMGIWQASKCGHIVHDMVIYEGWCTTCWDKHQDEIVFAESKIKGEEWDDDDGWDENDTCAMCGKGSTYAKKYGICYECQEAVVTTNIADEIHNSITDPYKAVNHACRAGVQCIGVVIADNCKHAVHNREIQDGLCPACFSLKNKKPEVS
jgi:hypothetical protein